jgi:hypothetical protein
MHENLHLTHGEGMQSFNGQVAHRRLFEALHDSPNRHRATISQEDDIAFS